MFLKEYIKLLHRCYKYRYVADGNEIGFLLKKIKNGATVIDAGAHKGGYTFWMQKAVGKRGKVIAFEPQQKGAELLNKLFSNQNVIVEHLALSDKETIMELHVQPQSFDVSFEASLNNKYADATIEKVQTISLDSYCKKQNIAPSFIKIDVEGHEQNVINGAAVLLATSKPILLIEIEARHIGPEALYGLCRQIIAFGYCCYFFYGKQTLPFTEFDILIHQDVKNINTNLYSNNFVFEPF